MIRWQPAARSRPIQANQEVGDQAVELGAYGAVATPDGHDADDVDNDSVLTEFSQVATRQRDSFSAVPCERGDQCRDVLALATGGTGDGEHSTTQVLPGCARVAGD